MEVTRRLAFYDLKDWWLSNERVQELLVNPRTGVFASDPFFPVAQQPEGGFPYVRYTVAREVGFPTWWMHTEMVGIDLYMSVILHSTEILNIFIDMAGRGDQSADDLNRWLEQRNQQLATPRPIDFEYHSIQFVGGGDIGASNEEGGAFSRIMMFNIDYSPRGGRNIA
jgi:hypothetical protein